jgi:hypothetical protein
MLFALDTSLITAIVIIVISALSSWAQQRKQKREEEAEWGGWGDSPAEHPSDQHPSRHSETPPTPTTAPRPTASNWEEELRRMLGEAPAAPPPRAPQPPPIVVVQPKPQPPPVPVYTPARPEPEPVYAEENYEELVTPAPRLGQLSEASIAYERASQLHANVAEQLRQIKLQTQQHSVISARQPQRARSQDAGKVVQMLRNPHTVRQAIIASMVLNPPKALEN